MRPLLNQALKRKERKKKKDAASLQRFMGENYFSLILKV